MDPTPLRLTETVQKGGCAAKMPAGQLRAVLERISLNKPQELLIGTETMDDACLWDLGQDLGLVQTLDFFTPIVDDPHDFGAIAAANALSDVYAMGGEPKIALSILAFPSATLPMSLLDTLLSGAISVIHEAGACLAGGHTIDDDTLKLGFSVTGFVPKKSVWSNRGAQPGDRLILTKGLGTGTITSALKSKKAASDWIQAAVTSMRTLNRVRDLLGALPVHAATDVTGFGLGGHLLQMCRASGVRARIRCQDLPVLEGARECLRQGILNKAHYANKAYIQDSIGTGDGSEIDAWLVVDPQTSGGLLLAVPEDNAGRVVAALKGRFPFTAIVGEVHEGTPGLDFV